MDTENKIETMESPFNLKNTTIKAEQLLSGKRLIQLRTICENQKTISTKKLDRCLNDLQEGMRLDAIHLMALARTNKLIASGLKDPIRGVMQKKELELEYYT